MMVISAALFLPSCKKNELNTTTSTTENLVRASANMPYTIRNGTLVFENGESLQEFINKVKKMSEDEFKSWNLENTKFTSLYRQYQIMDQNAENEIGISADSAINAKQIAWIPDDLFASAVSDKGFLAVGDSLYKYESDGFKVAPIEAIEDLDSYPFESLDNHSYTPMLPVNMGNQNWASFPPKSRFFNYDDNNNAWPKHKNRPIRATHTTWCSWFGVYTSAGARIKMEKKTKLLGWINWQHSSAHISCNSPIRYWSMWAGPFFSWDYYFDGDIQSTSNQNVCGVIFSIRTPVSNLPTLYAGPLQHAVNGFESIATISYGGKSKSDTWVH